MRSLCSVANCERSSWCRGYCVAHYRRWHKGGDPGPAAIASRDGSRGECGDPLCSAVATRGGYCYTHHSRRRRAGATSDKACSVVGCTRAYYGKTYCEAHYKQVRVNGKLNGKPLRVMGAGHLTRGGYRLMYRPDHPNANADGQIMEHRLVMSEHINRPLFDDENVHHRNGVRADNRPDNLELWSTAQPIGQRVDDKIAWMKAFIARYE